MADILVIDDRDRTADLCRRIMPEYTWHGPARSWEEARQLLKKLRRQVELVLLDVHFDIPDDQLLGLPADPTPRDISRAKRTQGAHILEALRRSWPDLPVVLMTARGGVGLERVADRHQAEEYTYFLQDEDLDARSLNAQVAGILQARRGREQDGPVYWGRSMTMRRIRQRLTVLARGRLPVIMAGPTGTGKSLIARHFIHPRSNRKGRFVSVDLATIPQDLVAAHLFGSVRGAYTGSVSDRKGAFEEADGGTLFLDEIGNLRMEHQKMLLTVLQEGAVTRLGDIRERQVNVKLVVATNEDLGGMVRKGTFRADLYMRLNPAATVALPPLRDRQVDMDRLLTSMVQRGIEMPHLAELLDEYCDQNTIGNLPSGGRAVRVISGGEVPQPAAGVVLMYFPERTVRQIRKHSWPGNLREFAMTLENALMLCLAEAVDAASAEGRADVIQVRPKLVRDLLLATATEDEVDSGLKMELHIRPAEGLNKVAQDIERQYFTRLYLQERGDFSAMASILLGDSDAARKVQLRFNQLGLKVRELKTQLT
ncbi:MAG: DNA-binding NtrC family response regulator [Myxococcota bacterium]|jgi:DNA-binding NtrC family response regulator